MDDTSRGGDAPEFPGRQAAVCLGVALLVSLFLVLFLTWRDNGRRASLESTTELTAVGDSHYFTMPAKTPLPPYQAVTSFQGQPLYPTGYDRHEFPPDDMTRIGVDDKGGSIIYQGPPRAKAGDDPKLGPVYFLKISPKEYLKTRPSKPIQ